MIYHGKQAIKAAEKFLGRTMKPEERRACYLEGYSDEVYLDTKGIETFGMGQTGEWIKKGLEAALNAHEVRVLNRLQDYHTFPEYLRCELYQAEYRGDLGHSPNTCRLINARRYDQAAIEFLNNAEYKTAPESIRRRMESVATALSLYDLVREV
jgi:GH24 family phage-related lysozyme (muramidase)